MLVMEIRLWTQKLINVLFVVYGIKHFAPSLRDVIVGGGNPVMDKKSMFFFL